jgi:hypothetical protein
MSGVITMKVMMTMISEIVGAVIEKIEGEILTTGNEIIITAMTAGETITEDIAKATTGHIDEIPRTNILTEIITINRPKRIPVAETILNLPHPVSLALGIDSHPLDLQRLQSLLPETAIIAIVPLPPPLPVETAPHLAPPLLPVQET